MFNLAVVLRKLVGETKGFSGTTGTSQEHRSSVVGMEVSSAVASLIERRLLVSQELYLVRKDSGKYFVQGVSVSKSCTSGLCDERW